MIEYKNISTFNSNIETIDPNEVLLFTDLKLQELDLSFINHEGGIIVRNCIIENLYLYYSHLKGGFTFENNTVKNWIIFEAGVHNKKPFILRNNKFEGFFHFFDCIFESSVIIENNTFEQGSDLLGNLTDVHTEFESPPIIKNNIGRLDLNHDMLTKLNLRNKYFIPTKDVGNEEV